MPPKSSDEAIPLRKSIERLLQVIPEVWLTVNLDALSSFDQRALFLLVAAGMVERRIAMRVRSSITSFDADVELTATGECGFAQAMEPISARMWAEGSAAYEEWYKSHGKFPPHLCEVVGNSWRLTDQGVIARNDLMGTTRDRQTVFEFVLKQGFFCIRPQVHGAGHMIRLTRTDNQQKPTNLVPAPVAIDNWGEGARQFAEQFLSAFGKAMQERSEGALSPVAQPSASKSPEVPGASEDSSDRSRKKRTKEETTKLVHAAIAFKMKNPEWSESKCAEEAGLPVSTLNGNSVWKEWRRKIDSAQNGGTLSAVKRAFDRRTGEFLAVDDTETDDSE